MSFPRNSSHPVSLLEVLPKDKKAKEEKTNVLGQTVVDLLPLLLGESPLQLTRRLHPPSGQEGPPGARGEGGLGEGKVRTVPPGPGGRGAWGRARLGRSPPGPGGRGAWGRARLGRSPRGWGGGGLGGGQG